MNECKNLTQKVNIYGFKKVELRNWKDKIPLFSIELPRPNILISVHGDKMEEIDERIKELRDYYSQKYPTQNIWSRKV